MAIVYIHIGEDNNEIFYVGIGKSESRAKSKHKRSKFWKDYTEIHGFRCEILFSGISWEEACIKEIELIKFYGRRDLKNGTLVNMTEGGQGGATCKGLKNPKLSERNKSMRGKPFLKLRWINKNGKNTRTTEDKIQEFLNKGWIRGQIKTGPREKSKGREPWNKGIKYKAPNISKALKGIKKTKYKKRETMECQYCGKISDSTTIKRWHLDKCKAYEK